MLLLRAPWFRELVGGPECDPVTGPRYSDLPVFNRRKFAWRQQFWPHMARPGAGTRFLCPDKQHRREAPPDTRVSCNFEPVWLLSGLSAAIRLPQLAGSILIGIDLRNNSRTASRASDAVPLFFDRFGPKCPRLCKTQAPTANHPSERERHVLRHG